MTPADKDATKWRFLRKAEIPLKTCEKVGNVWLKESHNSIGNQRHNETQLIYGLALPKLWQWIFGQFTEWMHKVWSHFVVHTMQFGGRDCGSGRALQVKKLGGVSTLSSFLYPDLYF